MVADIRVLLVVNSSLTWLGLRVALESTPYVAIIGEVAELAEALRQVEITKPDVIIADCEIVKPAINELVRTLEQASGLARILVLNSPKDDECFMEMIEAGVLGYLLTGEKPEVVIEAVQTVYQGQPFFSPNIAEQAIALLRKLKTTETDRQQAGLTKREEQILALMAQGHGNAEIAQALVLSEGTVKNHVSSIYTKLGVRVRLKLVEG